MRIGGWERHVKDIKQMSNLITRTTSLAMEITLGYVRNGDIVVDATCGAGQDTVSLAKAVGNGIRQYA